MEKQSPARSSKSPASEFSSQFYGFARAGWIAMDLQEYTCTELSLILGALKVAAAHVCHGNTIQGASRWRVRHTRLAPLTRPSLLKIDYPFNTILLGREGETHCYMCWHI